MSLDEAIGRELMTVLEPAAIGAAVLASEQENCQQDEIIWVRLLWNDGQVYGKPTS
jgi:hypothetical protein